MHDSSARHFSESDAKNLAPGAEHYTAYVGPPENYDLMGASQFRLLTALGLRDHHRLLDFGCGSLRAGRLFIPYLQTGHYYGLEPNRWLIDDAIANQVGADQVRIKQPVFLHNEDFDARAFGQAFDFILAQSIFSHTGRDLILKALTGFRDSLTEDGLIAATFIPTREPEYPGEFTGSGWVYPGCVAFRQNTLHAMFKETGLHGVEIPWHHPHQRWFVLAKSPALLPTRDQFNLLTGQTLAQDAKTVGSGSTLQRLKQFFRQRPTA